jgi:outer membrane protein TolC
VSRLAAFVWVSVVFGPSLARAEGLRVSEAIQRAQAIAPQSRGAAHLVEAARARQREASAGYIPTLNADAVAFTGFSGSSGSNLGVRGMVASPFIDHYAAALEGSWSVLEFLRIGPRVAAAQEEESAALADRTSAERDVAIAVIDTYERVLSLGAVLAAMDQDLSSRQAEIAVLEAQLQGGTVPEAEVLQSRAGMARIAADRAKIDAEHQAARAALVVLTGDARFASASLEFDPLAAAPTLAEVRTAVARRNEAERLRELGARELTPRLVISGSGGFANPAPGKDTGYYAVGAAVIVPLTAFVGEKARQEAQAQTAEARADAADARRQQVALQIASLRATLTGVRASTAAVDASEHAARAALEALQARIQAGAVRAAEIESARTLVVDTSSTAAVLRIRILALQAKLALLGG